MNTFFAYMLVIDLQFGDELDVNRLRRPACPGMHVVVEGRTQASADARSVIAPQPT